MTSPFIAQNGSPLGYYRFPTIYGDIIIFTAEGDLWRVGIQGGLAQRLTTHHGVESHSAISPDGTMLAFSAQYEGPTEVYAMPLAGGLPSRMTYEGGQALVVRWKSDGKILYSTRHYSTLPNTQLATIHPETGEQEIIPLNQASEGVFEPTGKTLFFTRLPFQGSHTKRYKGGTVQNLWKFTAGEPEAIPLTTDYPGTSKAPMWWDSRVYFVSDRDGTMNIWSMNENGADLCQHTQYKGWDVQSPALHQNKIVYQLGADIHVFDIETGKNSDIPITLASDFDQTRERWVKKPMEYLTSAHISPKGDRIVLTARGQVFVAPAEQGRLVEATRKNGVRYRNARFMPDGKSILLLSDETGELEFWKIPANGVGDGEALTDDGKVFRFEGIPSPDGKCIAYTDKDHQLWIYQIEEKRQLRVAVSERYGFQNLQWAPDSQWLAYVGFSDNLYPQTMLYHLSDGSTTTLTSARVDSYNPVWSRDGKWIYFLSDRSFQSLVQSPWGPRQPEPYFDKTTKIYMIALTEEYRSPFQLSDEVYQAEMEEKKEKEKNDDEDTPEADENDQNGDDEEDEDVPVEVTIDLDGIQRRVMEVPISSGNYESLSTSKKRLFWIERSSSINSKRKLVTLDIDNKEIKSKTLVDNVKSYEMSLDGKKIMLHKGDDIYVFEASTDAPAKLENRKVDLKNWTFSIIPREEWRQMLVEAWRLERDYFYDKNMHGVDWKGLLEKHLTLVERVTDRYELNDLIAQFVGELSALHIFVQGGDQRKGDDQVRPASLGTALIRDEDAGGYRIDHIYQSEPDYPERLSPLAKPGLKIKEGDIIETINGIPTLSAPHPRILLKNYANQQVLLKVKSASSGESFNEVVNPISPEAEDNLRYDEWEYTRRIIVEEVGKGEIGYVHLRAMGGGNYSEWARNYYPVFNRKGLIIDVRHNTGGNIDSWILEKLLRKAWFYWQPRVGKPTWNMQYAFRGHIVALCNERTASDGEAFIEGFRRLGLGKIIGTRTWGGEIWLSFSNWLVDKGIASAAEMGVYGPEGEWLIEGHGVEPDIVVDNLPHTTFEGKDVQLETAIEYLREQIRLHPVDVPPPPPHPDKSFEYE